MTELLPWLRDQEPAMVETLRRWVAAESPSDDPERTGALVRMVAEEAEHTGLRALLIPGRRSGGMLVARPVDRRRGAPYQLLVGHLDTVWPQGTLRRMPITTRDGRVTGPGSYDAKAGLVQALFALRALAAVGRRPEVEPVLIATTDEEVGSRESARHLRRLARCADRAFVLEPSAGPQGDLKTARKGIGRYTITVHGVAAHAGLDPTAGASAILELSHQIQALFALNDPERGLTVNVGTIDGGLRPNVVAPMASAVVEVRAPTLDAAAKAEQAIRALRAVTPGCRVEVDGGLGRLPMEPTPASRALWERARSVAAELGIPLDQQAVGGASDGNLIAPLTPTLDGLGAVGEGAHAANEQVRIEALAERAALLAGLMTSPPLKEEPWTG